MRQSADIVKVQRILRVIGTGDVRIRPRRRLLQVIRREMQINRTTAPTTLHGEVKLGSTPLHVVAPFDLWIEIGPLVSAKDLFRSQA